MKRAILALLLAIVSFPAPASELTDAIARTGAARVQADLQAAGNTHAGWKLLNLLWPEPQMIAPAADALGLTTMAQAQQLADQLRDAVGMPRATALERLLNPALPGINLADLQRVEFTTIHRAVVAQTRQRADFAIHQSDRYYHLPTRAMLEQIAAAQPFTARQWTEETQDCDDFARMFLGWLASKGLGNLAIGFAGLTYYGWGGEVLGGHAVAMAVDDTGAVWFIDPRVRGLHSPMGFRLGATNPAITADYRLALAVY